MNHRCALIGLGAALLLSIASGRARAGTPPVGADATPGAIEPAKPSDRDSARQDLVAFTRPRRYLNLFGSVMLGGGLRFNNPYRLPHDLGERGASVSTTAPYVDLAVAATTGKPDGVQHGARLAWSVPVSGVPQQVITPAYLALLRLAPTWTVYGWAGVPILLQPDFNAGAELALGGSWLARAGLGATFAVVGDAFYGAGTRDTRAAFYPVLSAQLGFFVNYEVLP